MSVNQLLPRTMTVFGIEAQTYDLMMGIGLGLFVAACIFACRRAGMRWHDAIILACLIPVGGFISARIAAYMVKGHAGQSLYAASVGAMLLGSIYAHARTLSLIAIGNAAAPAAALAFGVMKLGCLASGCCSGSFIIPVQLLTSLLCFALFAASFFVHKRLAFILVGYASGRFIIDFFGNDLIRWGPLALHQYAGLIFIALGAALLLHEHVHDIRNVRS